MTTRKLSPAWMLLAAILAVSVLAITFSPSVRAAIRNLITINDVSVYQDEETGNLVVEEDQSDAVIYQDDETVVIQNSDGESVSLIQPDSFNTENLAVEDVTTNYPDFVMPTNIPAGYTLIPMAFAYGSETVGVGWQSSEGHQITYTWNVEARDFPEEADAYWAEYGYTIEEGRLVGHSIAQDGSHSMTGGLTSDGYYYQLNATDTNISLAEIESIIP